MREVLLVNDDEEISQQLGDELETAGWAVYLASSEKEVFQYCVSSRPAMVVVDMEMGAASAFDCIGTTRGLYPDLFIVAVTRGGKDRLWPGAAAVCGASEFVDGPVPSQKLAEILENGLSQFRVNSGSPVSVDNPGSWANS